MKNEEMVQVHFKFDVLALILYMSTSGNKYIVGVGKST